MPRINISIDLSNNEILTEEIDNAIKAAVKSKAREYFHQTLDEELQRIIDSVIKQWTYRGMLYTNPNKLEKAIQKQIDTQISEEISELNLSSEDIQKAIDAKLGTISDIIASSVAKKVEKISFEDYISELVEKEVHRELPEKVLQLLVSKVADKN